MGITDNTEVEATDTSKEDIAEKSAPFVGRLFEAGLGAFELLTVYLGDRLGLYRALHRDGPATPAELAARTGTDERYVREWLEQQAVTGILAVQNGQADPGTRVYRLPPEHVDPLVTEESPFHIVPLARFIPSIGGTTSALLEAFRTGQGVPYATFGPDAREGQAGFNRPAFSNLLAKEWLPAVPDVHARLQADPPAKVADIACGAGWSSIAIARAYPTVAVDGFDLDEASIDLARKNADASGVADRVRFEVRDASDPALQGQYDLVLMIEALHDLGRPVEVLRVLKGLAGESGTVIIVDERVDEVFTAPNENPVERFMYAVSVLFCLPTGRADGPSPHGTVLRPAQLSAYARQGGFGEVEVLPIDYDFFRFYRLHP